MVKCLSSFLQVRFIFIIIKFPLLQKSRIIIVFVVIFGEKIKGYGLILSNIDKNKTFTQIGRKWPYLA